MSTIKHTIVSLTTLFCLLCLLGCTSKESTSVELDPVEEPIQLTFWFDNAGPHRTAIWEKLIADFEEKHPHIDIQYEGFFKDTAKSKFDAAIAAGNVPDVASIYTSWLSEYAVREALYPLDSFFEQWHEQQNINPQTIEFNRSMTLDGRLYGIPYTQNLDVLWVRTDWLKQANLPNPTTWEEFFHTVSALTDIEREQYGYSIRGGAGSSFQLQRMMYAYSGISTYISEGKSTVNDPVHVEFLKKYFSLYQKYTPIRDITNDYSSMLLGFGRGEIGMIQHNVGSLAEHSEQLAPEQFEVIPIPKSIEGHYVVEDGNTMNISILSQTDYPDEAWTFLTYLTSQEAQSYWNKEVGQIPTHQAVFSEPWAKEAPHLQVALGVYNDAQTQFYTPPFYLTEYYTIRNTIVEPGIQAVLSGTKSVETFLNEWAAIIEDTHKRYDAFWQSSNVDYTTIGKSLRPLEVVKELSDED